MNCFVCNQKANGGSCLGKVVPIGRKGLKALALIPMDERYLGKSGIEVFCSVKCGLAGVERYFQTQNLERPRSASLSEPAETPPDWKAITDNRWRGDESFDEPIPEGGWRLDD